MIRCILRYWFPSPDVRFGDVGDIRLCFLRAMGITCLLCDLDNTLTLRKATNLSPEARRLFRRAKKLGMKIVIVSNVGWGRERGERVQLIAKLYDVACVCAYFPMTKPHPKPFLDAMALCGATPEQTAMIGDQCGTDGRGARALGIWFIKVRPLGPDHWISRPRRWLERFVHGTD